VYAATQRLECYTVVLTRQERRGFGPFKRLHPPERILCWYRREPFSVRFKWTDPDIKYGESTYVRGAEGDRVRFTPRVGMFGLKPEIVRVRLQTPVTWGEAKHPVDEFGLESLMQQTLDYISEADGACAIEYLDVQDAPPLTRPAHLLRITYPADRHEAPVQELYIDAEADLPVATVSRFLDGALDASYHYSDLNPHVRLTDADFLLEAERRRLSQRAEGGDAGLSQ
jgi:hypothetical protein